MYTRDDPQSIRLLFNNIAKRYQFANTMLSFGLARSWRQRLVGQIPRSIHSILDCCCGSGDLIQEIQKQMTQVTVTGLDFSEAMLQVAFDPLKKPNRLIQGDVCHIPLKGPFDGATLAFSLRNIPDLPLFFKEVYRVLAPGGGLYFLELTKPVNPILRIVYFVHLHCLLPVLGGLLTGHFSAYRYLARSIAGFHENAALIEIIEVAGFSNVRMSPICGGVCHIITAQKKGEA
jgi:demethylmenaquinone methyltransferase/2-methoxy-6-polyprenyl-1,4-benzoquinol methylase